MSLPYMSERNVKLIQKQLERMESIAQFTVEVVTASTLDDQVVEVTARWAIPLDEVPDIETKEMVYVREIHQHE